MAAMDAAEKKCNCDMPDAMDTSEALAGFRYRAMADAMDTSEDLPVTQGTRCRASGPHLPLVAEREIAKEHTQWRRSEMKAHWDANHAYPFEGADAAIPSWSAEVRSKVLGRELSEAEEKVSWGNRQCC